MLNCKTLVLCMFSLMSSFSLAMEKAPEAPERILTKRGRSRSLPKMADLRAQDLARQAQDEDYKKLVAALEKQEKLIARIERKVALNQRLLQVQDERMASLEAERDAMKAQRDKAIEEKDTLVKNQKKRDGKIVAGTVLATLSGVIALGRVLDPK